MMHFHVKFMILSCQQSYNTDSFINHVCSIKFSSRQKLIQKHFLWILVGPDSSYSSLEIHIFWKVEREADRVKRSRTFFVMILHETPHMCWTMCLNSLKYWRPQPFFLEQTTQQIFSDWQSNFPLTSSSWLTPSLHVCLIKILFNFIFFYTNKTANMKIYDGRSPSIIKLCSH